MHKNLKVYKMEKCKDHTQEKQDSGECCQVVEKAKAEQQTYEYTVKLKKEKHE